jgi:cytochrome P450
MVDLLKRAAAWAGFALQAALAFGASLLVLGGLVVLLGKGLLTSESDFWLRQRRLIQPVFVRNRIMQYGPAMVSATVPVRWKLSHRSFRGRGDAKYLGG